MTTDWRSDARRFVHGLPIEYLNLTRKKINRTRRMFFAFCLNGEVILMLRNDALKLVNREIQERGVT